jgi:hypothetical protein
MVIFYVYMRERAKKSPFYVAYTRKTVCEVFNLRMQRKKLRKPSYAYMRVRYGAKEITALEGVHRHNFSNIKGFVILYVTVLNLYGS